MKRILNKKISKQEAIDNSKNDFGRIGKKQIIGHVRVKHSGKPAENKYILEDDTQVFEDDDGKALKEMSKPVKLSQRIKAEIAIENGELDG